MDNGKGVFIMFDEAAKTARAMEQNEAVDKILNSQGGQWLNNKPPGITPDMIPAMQKLEADNPGHGGWFRVGEIIEIRGSRFRVKSIKPDEIRLKLLKKG